MAVVLDINLLCKEIIDFSILKDIMNNYEVNLDTISSIDNWMWDNEQKVVNDFNSMSKILNQNKIIVIKLASRLFKDLGIYIEKTGTDYLYTLWLNTEGYPQLDSDLVNIENRIYYESVYQEILKFENKNPELLKIVGIGIESDFFYSRDIVDIIRNSKNITAWILNGNIKDKISLSRYSERSIKGTDKKIFEKIKKDEAI